MADKTTILVVGSINMDLVVRTAQLPAPGQTVLGRNFTTAHGGKGANQAVAAARLGGQVRMIGCLGADSFGQTLREGLENEGVDVEHVMQTEEAPTGTAMIVVNSQGENSIVVAAGANSLVTPDDIYTREELFAEAAVVLLQLELPLPAVRAAIDLGRRHGAKTILDPAPVPKNFCDELCNVDIFSPNVMEAEILTGQKALEERADKAIATHFVGRGAKTAILKLGARGSLVVMADGHFYRVQPYKVKVQDSTGAGDAFNAALSVALCRGDRMHDAARFANAAGALACTKFGAQTALPTAIEVKMLMDDQPK